MPRDYSLSSTPPNAMRRPQFACDDDWVRQFLSLAQVGHLATRWDEQPFLTPTLFWYDPDRHVIYCHSNLTGRLRANAERCPEVCFSVFNAGALLPSNVALEFSIQYESVVAFGKIRVLDDPVDQRRALSGLIGKYFPHLQPGEHYRPITDQELLRTAAYEIAIESWSGKRNWPDAADQSQDWKPLDLPSGTTGSSPAE
jgi:uncharacterized protein